MGFPEFYARFIELTQSYLAIASYPEHVVDLAVGYSQHFSPKVIASIFNVMDSNRKVAFIVELAKKYDATPSTERLLIESIVEPFLNDLIKAWNPQGEKATQIALLSNISKFPIMVAKRIIPICQMGKEDLIESVFNMAEVDGAAFQKEATTALSHQNQYRDLYTTWLTRQQPLLSWMCTFMAQMPQFLATAMAAIKPGVKTCEEDVIGEMNQVQRKLYLTSYINSTYKSHFKYWLQGLKDYPTQQFPGQYALSYMKEHLGKFVLLIMDDADLGTDDERTCFALNLLEHMAPADATQIINEMDENKYSLVSINVSWGYPHFNLLANTLVQEAVRTDLTASRQLLMARFYHAAPSKRFDIESSKAGQAFARISQGLKNSI